MNVKLSHTKQKAFVNFVPGHSTAECRKKKAKIQWFLAEPQFANSVGKTGTKLRTVEPQNKNSLVHNSLPNNSHNHNKKILHPNIESKLNMLDIRSLSKNQIQVYKDSDNEIYLKVEPQLFPKRDLNLLVYRCSSIRHS